MPVLTLLPVLTIIKESSLNQIFFSFQQLILHHLKLHLLSNHHHYKALICMCSNNELSNSNQSNDYNNNWPTICNYPKSSCSTINNTIVSIYLIDPGNWMD